jgi:AmmeMemoRadiSam system protein A
MTLKAAYLVPHPPLIHPQVGRGRERQIEATVKAYKQVAREIKEYNPDTLVVMSPHTVMYSDYFHLSPGGHGTGDFSSFGGGKKSLRVEYDQEFVKLLSRKGFSSGISIGTEGEREPALDHGTLVPLSMVLGEENSIKVVRMGMSGLSVLHHYRVGQLLVETAAQLGRTLVFLASGDLSHRLEEGGPYGYAPEGPAFDETIRKICEEADFFTLLRIKPSLCERAGECGYRSLVTLAGTLDGREVKSNVRSYEGPFGVGYMVAGFFPGASVEERKFGETFRKEEEERIYSLRGEEDPYIRLARRSLETKIREGRSLAWEEVENLPLPKPLKEDKGGVFVTLKKFGNLRGCIGTTVGMRRCLGEEILHNAVSAGLDDPRFEPVEEEELDVLEYSVDVLGPREPISSMDQLNPMLYGVVVQKDHRKGLLLPHIDGIDTPQQQVKIALEKAGISPGEAYTMERFTVERHQ